ncbi:1845_t:CDS:10, partial [Funneliformis caledonium]
LKRSLQNKLELGNFLIRKYFEMSYMSEVERSKLKYPDYWDREPDTWGSIKDWDFYLLKKLDSSQKSDSKFWEKKEQISSLLLEADVVELELEIAKKRGRYDVHQIARRGYKTYSDIEFGPEEREQKRIRDDCVDTTPYINNSRSTTSAIPASEAKQNHTSENNKDLDEMLKFDLKRIEKQLQSSLTIEYQFDVIKKAKNESLTYKDVTEILALSSVMLLCPSCPYPIFTNREWKEITRANPYTIKEPPLPPEISSSLHNTASRYLYGEDVFMDRGESELGKKVALMFNNLYACIPEIAPSKLSEEEHIDMFVYPITRSLFRGPEKEYELRLNRAVQAQKKTDLSCVVDDITILNSEFKPLGCYPRQRYEEKLKAQLRGRKSINQQLQKKDGPGESAIFTNLGNLMESYFMDLKYDGIYRSWHFLTTRLVVDKTTIPQCDFAISHMIALEEQVSKISENYKYREHQSSQTMLPIQKSFM